CILRCNCFCCLYKNFTFRSGPASGIAVNVNPHGIATAENFCSIGIEHWNEIKVQVAPYQSPDGVKFVIVATQEIQNIENRHGCGAFIAMHLRPEHDLFLACPEFDLVDISFLHRLSELMKLQSIVPGKLVKQTFYFLVFESFYGETRLFVLI